MPNLQFPPRLAFPVSSLAASAFLCAGAVAQNFTMQVTNSNPLGLGSFVPEMEDLDLGLEGNIKGDLDYGISLDSLYDSNLTLTDKNQENDLSAILTPWLSYTSDPEGGANLVLTAGYSPVARAYMNNSDLNGVDQSGDFTLRARGAKTDISVFGRYSQSSGTDRIAGPYVEGTVATAGIRVARQLAARTWMSAGWSVSASDYGSGSGAAANEGSEIYTTYVGGLWEVSPRLSIGPTLQYTTSVSDNIGDREAWALLLEARYQLGQRVWLSTSIGPEYATISDGSGDNGSFGLTGNLTALYLISERWSWSNTVRSAAVPSPNTSNYVVNDITITTELQRQLLRGSIGGGVAYSFSGYEEVGTVTTERGNENNFSFFLSYRRPLFSDRIAFDSTINYNVNEGAVDWTQLQIRAGLDIAF